MVKVRQDIHLIEGRYFSQVFQYRSRVPSCLRSSVQASPVVCFERRVGVGSNSLLADLKNGVEVYEIVGEM